MYFHKAKKIKMLKKLMQKTNQSSKNWTEIEGNVEILRKERMDSPS